MPRSLVYRAFLLSFLITFLVASAVACGGDDDDDAGASDDDSGGDDDDDDLTDAGADDWFTEDAACEIILDCFDWWTECPPFGYGTVETWACFANYLIMAELFPGNACQYLDYCLNL
ncbi:MAG: hypothetical protein P9L99_19770 [Candidatus Lernaella stagnicola]|nr:hypothetical protein [Candidatus Lernaella stagnicola]